MFILKLAAAAFLVSLNIFSFLLVKFQKNDREKKILKSIVKEDRSSEINKKDNNKDEEKQVVPDKEEQEKAKQALESMEKKPDDTEKMEIMPDASEEIPKDNNQKQEEKQKLIDKFCKKPVTDLKLFLCAVLGGSLGIYISLFTFRYRLRDILMMVLIPTILVINVYIYFQLFTIWLIFPAKAATALLGFIFKA